MRDISLADASSTQVDEQRQYRLSDERSFQTHALGSEKHLIIKALSNGCIYSIEHGEILINQVLASPLAGSIHRIYLRIPDERRILSTEIVGPGASSEFTAEADRFCWRGSWQRLSYECQCWLPPLENTWVFHVEIQNTSGKTVLCDAMGLQDIGLATRAQVRNNERYTAQYLDHFAAPHPQLGHLLMTRQNLPQPHGKHPWLLQGCFPRMAGFVTDGFDFFGAGFRETGIPEALSRNTIGTSVRQYEASYTAIQSSRLQIPPGGTRSCSYFSQFSAHHPEPSSTSDIDERAISEFRAACQNNGFKSADSSILSGSKPPESLFQTSALFEAKTLEETEIRRLFPGPLRHEEFDGSNRLSFFALEDSHHVVLKAKELSVERSHGHIMRSGQGLTPDSEVMSCTFYAPGVFASQMALGNTVLGKFISTVRDPLNIIRSGGLRIWVRRQSSDSWELLGVPSAFEMATHFCRWYYKSDHDLLTVTCSSSDEDPAFIYTILSEHHPIEILIGGEISAGPNEYDSSPRMMIDRKRARITIRPDPATLLAEAQPNISFHIVSSTPHAIEALGGDELLGPANSSPVLPYFAVRSHATSRFSLSFLGVFDNPVHGEGLCSKYETLNTNLTRDMPIRSEFWSGINSKFRIAADGCARTSQLQDALVWMARDAVIHLNVPRGLEQANGGAWGVRDVCQGPIEFLIARNLPDVAKKILIELFSQQYRRRGDWPQWFMFPPFQQIQSKTCHGDIVIWPLKALCDYLEETDDGEFLHHGVPYTDDKTLKRGTESETILEHVDRLLKKFRRSFLLGLSLPRFGEGDWDDSLQPKRKVLAEQMVSSWTTALAYQTLSRYAVTLRHFGMDERADAVTQLADAIRADFQRTLMPDGVVAGFAVFGARSDQVEEYLLHPRDKTTGIRYRLISMSRGILSGIFSPAQAEHHLDLVRQHLLAPDGARLMDRPTRYQGGRETIFRRSESASFFGREIGLQYTHAHLRYAEALATMGRADELMQALLTANPIAVTEVVKNARMRQRNCYFSSSDAAFTDRYQASESYDKVRTGEIPVDGGWRIYSSGPGIYTNLVIRHLFGLRRFFDFVEFDPVLPREFREVCCDTIHQSRKVRYRFVAVENSSGSSPISINGTPITSCIRVKNAYRPAGIRIARSEFQHALSHPDNVVQIETQLQREE